MKTEILELYDIFDILVTDHTLNKDKEEVSVYFENEFAWASVLYNPWAQKFLSATVESKDRKYYYQFTPDDSEIVPDALKLDVYEDFTEKAKAIWNDEPFDERVIMVLDLDDDVKEALIQASELKGVTIDDFIESALKELIDEYNEKGME